MPRAKFASQGRINNMSAIRNVIAEVKRAEVDRDARLRTQSEMRAHGFVRIDVCVTHEPAGQIRSDRQKREADRFEPPADLREMMAPSGVAGEVDVAGRRCDHE